MPAGDTDFEEIQGCKVTKEVVLEWQSGFRYRPSFSKFTVKLINKLDQCTDQAAKMLLDVTENLPTWWVILATTNKTPDFTTIEGERFWGPLHRLEEVLPPNEVELCEFVKRSEGVTAEQARLAVAKSGGGV